MKIKRVLSIILITAFACLSLSACENDTPHPEDQIINFLLERFHHELNNPGPKNNTNVINAVNQLNEMETFQAFVNEYFSDNKSKISSSIIGLYIS